MEMVITEGTGKPAFKDMPFAVAGKTGTAHVADGILNMMTWFTRHHLLDIFLLNDPAIHLHCCCSYKTSCCSSLWRTNSSAGFPRDSDQIVCDVYRTKRLVQHTQSTKDSSELFLCRLTTAI